jgi:hypothetical protein
MIMKPRTLTNFWLDLASLILILGLMVTGGLIHFVLPAGSGRFRELFGWNRHDIGQVHFYLAVATLVLLVLHLLLHWNWVCSVIAKALGRGFPSQRTRTVWGVGLLLGITLLLVVGLWWASRMVRPVFFEGGGRRRSGIEGAPVSLCRNIHAQAERSAMKGTIANA